MYHWYIMVSININKCQIINLSKKRNPINYCYCLTNNNLFRSSLVKDLEIWFDHKIIFYTHNSLKKFQFSLVKRNCSDFNNSINFKQLYIFRIHTQMKYASLIWENNSIELSNEMFSVLFVSKSQGPILAMITFKII